MTTNWLSYWNMPVSKSPVTSNFQKRGTATPSAGLTLACGDRDECDDVTGIHRKPGRQAGAEEDPAVHSRLGGLERRDLPL